MSFAVTFTLNSAAGYGSIPSFRISSNLFRRTISCSENCGVVDVDSIACKDRKQFGSGSGIGRWIIFIIQSSFALRKTFSIGHLFLLLLFGVLSFIGILHHEMWLDETQNWLMATESHSF